MFQYFKHLSQPKTALCPIYNQNNTRAPIEYMGGKYTCLLI